MRSITVDITDPEQDCLMKMVAYFLTQGQPGFVKEESETMSAFCTKMAARNLESVNTVPFITLKLNEEQSTVLTLMIGVISKLGGAGIPQDKLKDFIHQVVAAHEAEMTDEEKQQQNHQGTNLQAPPESGQGLRTSADKYWKRASQDGKGPSPETH